MDVLRSAETIDARPAELQTCFSTFKIMGRFIQGEALNALPNGCFDVIRGIKPTDKRYYGLLVELVSVSSNFIVNYLDMINLLYFLLQRFFIAKSIMVVIR